ncbi:MAG: copper-binding protein [Solimonas sp.]
MPTENRYPKNIACGRESHEGAPRSGADRRVRCFRVVVAPAPSASANRGTAPITITASGNGVVQHIDKARGVVTIKHGAVPALKMMPMTMSFAVKDPSQLANLRPMQEVQFQVSYDGDDYLITDIK